MKKGRPSMTPTIHSYAVMAATGDIGSVVAERPLLALSLAAALAFVLGCARPAEKEADDTTTEVLVAARDAAPSPSAKAPALPPPFHTESAARFPKIIRWPEGKTPEAPAGFRVSLYADGLDHPRWLYVLPNGDVLVAESATRRSSAGRSPSRSRKAIEGAGLTGPLGQPHHAAARRERRRQARGAGDLLWPASTSPSACCFSDELALRRQHRRAGTLPLPRGPDDDHGAAGDEGPRAPGGRLQQPLDPQRRREPRGLEALCLRRLRRPTWTRRASTRRSRGGPRSSR